MLIILPEREEVFPFYTKLGVQSFLRPDLTKLDNIAKINMGNVDLVTPSAKSEKGWISGSKFFDEFLEKGLGNHKRAFGVRYAAPFIGQHPDIFIQAFGDPFAEVLLALDAFEDSAKLKFFPVLKIKSEYHGRVKEVVLDKMPISKTITNFVKLPMISS